MSISQRRFYNFHMGKKRSTEAVPTGMVRQTLARMLKFGNMVCIMELVDNSFNYSVIRIFPWLIGDISPKGFQLCG